AICFVRRSLYELEHQSTKTGSAGDSSSFVAGVGACYDSECPEPLLERSLQSRFFETSRERREARAQASPAPRARRVWEQRGSETPSERGATRAEATPET